MRLACLTLVALYLLAAPAAAQPAWVIAYEQGVEAFNRGNDAVAETKLLEARERGPRQSRKASFGGLNLAPFIPDYYLGLIAARTGRHAEGIRLLEGALAQGLISQREEREFQLANAAITKAREDAARVAAEPPVWQAEFQRAMYAADQALKDKRFVDARVSANSARASAKDARSQTELGALERRIVAEEGAQAVEMARQAISRGNDTEAQAQIQRLSALNPQHPGLAQLRSDLADVRRRGEEQIAGRARTALASRNAAAAGQEIARLAAANPQHPALAALRNELASLDASTKPDASAIAAADATRRRTAAEREAVLLFHRGDYAGARQRLQAFPETPSPRMHLYLACSQAALAILNNDTSLAAAARRTYALARPNADQFATDLRYISPTIVKLLNGGAL